MLGRKKRELVALYFSDDQRLPPDLWWICLEISGLVKITPSCVWWHIHVPRFVYSRDLRRRGNRARTFSAGKSKD